MEAIVKMQCAISAISPGIIAEQTVFTPFVIAGVYGLLFLCRSG